MLEECTVSMAIPLLEGHTERWHTPIMDLAIRGCSKAFVASEHCQELIDRRWRGDYDGSACMLPLGASITQLLLRAACQVVPAFLVSTRR